MTAEAKVGITIVAKDAGASKTVKKLGANFTELNQSLELAKKGMRSVQSVVMSTVGKMERLRGVDDKLVIKLNQTRDSFSSLGASLGETVAPGIVGVGIAIRPVIRDFQGWIKEQRELMSMGFVDWVGDTADELNGPFAKAIIWVNKGLTGISVVFNVISGGIDRFASQILKTYASLTGIVGKVVSRLVPSAQEKIDKAFASSAAATRKYAKELEEHALTVVKKLNEQLAALEPFEDKVNDTSEAIRKQTQELKKAAKAATKVILGDLGKTKVDSVIGRLINFQATLAPFSRLVRENLQESFSDASQENVFALDKMLQKLAVLGAQVSSLGTTDMPRLLKEAVALKVISKDMALKLEADPSIFKAGMQSAVSVATASVSEIKGQLAALKSETDRLAAEMQASYGAAFSAMGNSALDYYKMHESLMDLEKDQSRDLAKMKVELQDEVAMGEMTTNEMMKELRKQEKKDNIALKEAEAEKLREFQRGVRDQIIQTALEYVIQKGIEVTASFLASKAKAAHEAEVLAAKVAAAGAKKVITTEETTTEILAASSQAGAKSLAAYSGIPFLGLALGLAAGAVIMAGIMKYMGKWSEGGYVTGGQKGKDSVPGLLMPGEYVLSVKQVEMWKKMSASMGREAPRSGAYAQGGPVVDAISRPSKRGEATSVNVSFKTNQLPNRAETKRWIRTTLSPALKELGQQGMLA